MTACCQSGQLLWLHMHGLSKLWAESLEHRHHICLIRCCSYYFFITQFCRASIREWLLIKNGYQSRVAFIKLSVIGKIFCKYEGFEKASFIQRTKNYDAVTWFNCLNYILLNVEHQIAFNLDAMDIEWKCRCFCTLNLRLFRSSPLQWQQQQSLPQSPVHRYSWFTTYTLSKF